MRVIDRQAIENMALGASLLGTGGGGDPYIGKLMALNAIEQHGPVTMISASEIPDDALVVPSAMMGAPVVVVEKLPNGTEGMSSFRNLEKMLGKKIYATLPIEAGGLNSMIPIAVAAQVGIPLVDADGMGRAFPELQMVTFHLDGIPASPMVLADEKGNYIYLEAISNDAAEGFAREITVQMGATAMICIYSMTGKQVKESAIHNILSYSENIGAIISAGLTDKQNPIEELLAATRGYLLFQGKISDVVRTTESGFNRGQAFIEGIGEFNAQQMEVCFQNENLLAKIGNQVMAMTPDLICIVDLHTMVPVTTEALRYGRRVMVLGLPCHEKWRTAKGIQTVGPRYFGYDLNYVEIEELASRRGLRGV